MTISEILKDVVQGNGWACLLNECKQAPDRWIDIYEVFIKERNFLIKKRDDLVCKSVACKITNVLPDVNIYNSLMDVESVIKDVEGAIKEITDYYIPKPDYNGEIVCLPKRVYNLLPLGSRDGYCIKEELTGLDELDITSQSELNTKQIMNAQDLSTEPHQENLKHQVIRKSNRGKGRPKETFKDKMIDDADGSKLQRIHEIMKDRKGKDAALIILACMGKGWMFKPTFTQVTEEFGDIGSKAAYNNYFAKKKFTDEEIEGVKNNLSLDI